MTTMAAPVKEKPRPTHVFQYLPLRQEYKPRGRKKYYTTFGLQVLVDGHELFRLNDVTMDMALMVRMSHLCNEGNLEPCHLYEVIENFLGEP